MDRHVWLILPIAALIVGAYVYEVRQPPVVPSSVRGAAYPEGGVYRAQQYCIRWVAERKRICKSRVYREFVDSVGTIFRLDASNGALATHIGMDLWAVCYHAPAAAAWGKGYHRASIDFSCDPISEIFPIKYRTPDIPVVILPDKQ